MTCNGMMYAIRAFMKKIVLFYENFSSGNLMKHN